MARTKELTIEEKLKILYELQQVDSKIDALRTLAGELPQEVKDMADEVEGLKTRLANIENEIKEARRRFLTTAYVPRMRMHLSRVTKSSRTAYVTIASSIT